MRLTYEELSDEEVAIIYRNMEAGVKVHTYSVAAYQTGGRHEIEHILSYWAENGERCRCDCVYTRSEAIRTVGSEAVVFAERLLMDKVLMGNSDRLKRLLRSTVKEWGAAQVNIALALVIGELDSETEG